MMMMGWRVPAGIGEVGVEAVVAVEQLLFGCEFQFERVAIDDVGMRTMLSVNAEVVAMESKDDEMRPVSQYVKR